MLPLQRFEKFVDYVLKIRRDEFLDKVGPKWSKRLVEHAEVFAKKFDGSSKNIKRPSIKMPGPRNNCASIRAHTGWSAFCA